MYELCMCTKASELHEFKLPTVDLWTSKKGLKSDITINLRTSKKRLMSDVIVDL
jgi:hypothetical protein